MSVTNTYISNTDKEKQAKQSEIYWRIILMLQSKNEDVTVK